MVFVRLNSLDFKLALSEFNTLLCKAMGPRGKVHLLHLEGGQLIVTSSSRRLLANIVFENPMFLFIIQTIQSHINRFEDAGLYCGIFMCTLYNYLLSNQICLTQGRTIFASLCPMVLLELRKEISSLHLKVALDSISPLLQIIKSVLWSKPIPRPKIYNGDQWHSDLMPLLILRGFLDCDGHVGRIHLKVLEGSHKPQLLHGVLYPCVCNEHSQLLSEQWRSVPIILVTTMMSDKRDVNESNTVGVEDCWNGLAHLEAAQGLVEFAAACQIRVIACQRVIHPSLLITMKRHGILALQRMGTQLTEAIQAITGATPISSLKSLTVDSVTYYKGYLNSVKHIELAEKPYLLLESSNAVKVLTLFLSSPSAESVAELEVVARQSLHALKQAVEDGALIPGAGCSEMFVCSFLSTQILQNKTSLCEENDCSYAELETATLWLQLALLHAVGLDLRGGVLAVDSVFHHAWRHSDQDTCFCGLVSSSDVTECKGRWQKTCTSQNGPLLPADWYHNPQPPLQNFKGNMIRSSIVLDVLSSKCNAFAVALENCIGLSNIGGIAFTKSKVP